MPSSAVGLQTRPLEVGTPPPSPGVTARERTIALSAMVAGAVLVTVAYGQARVSYSQGYFVPFWAGMLLAYGAAGWALLRRGAAVAPLVTLAGVTALPKLLMSPTAPIYYDESAHFQLLRHTLAHGALFQRTPLLPIGTHYPGLEASAAGVALVGGTGAWAAAEVVVVTAHFLVPLLVYLTARRIALVRPWAGVAALAYMTNPSYLYGDMQFAYESLGLVFVFASALCAVSALREGDRRRRAGFAGLAAALALACVVTHHLSALALCALLLLVAALDRSGTGEAGAAARWVPAATAVGAVGVWFGWVAPGTVSYLLPHLTGAVADVGRTVRGVATGAGSAGASRPVFADAEIPLYEVWAGVLAPFVLATFGAIAGVAWLRRRPLRRPLSWVYAIALAYFASVPLTLTTSGGTGAHRSWATTFLGVGLIVAVALAVHAVAVTRRPVRVALALALAVVLVGDTAQGVGVDYRFPSPYQYGSDTRTATSESRALATWVRRHLGPGAHVVTDRYTALALVDGADSITPLAHGALALGEFWYDAYPPGRPLMRLLHAGGDDYLVVDLRSTRYLPFKSALFAGSPGGIVPPANLQRLQSWPWLHALYTSSDYRLYRIDFRRYSEWIGDHDTRD